VYTYSGGGRREGGARAPTHSHPHTHAFVFFRGLLRRSSRGVSDEEALEGRMLTYADFCWRLQGAAAEEFARG
jgi:hypothetical protein